ncbi:hypothetical protein DPSP01_000570 [Paraphaeosphaeria sporulosa]|uniref:Uncharacterized protein n=1 Tax=Paraphaeosphaeria sporulosa TaxID=1460663 RepID=A0A177CA08_9PLEO|nr:uncharacterized protein CC84DRAFT_1218973 [Paraphaeosphaeria sporulosa]OAG03682.1 hypothetical protein CC84DRAFT_1218973 [Paraphaeosphaeria sporulosa]
MNGKQSDVRSTPLLLRIPGELRNHVYNYVLDDFLDSDGHRRFGGLLRRKYGPWNANGVFLDPNRHEARRRKVSLLQVCRVLRQEFRSLLLKAPLDITIDIAATYIDAFYPLPTTLPAETEFPPCRILLKQSPKPGRVFITELLKRLYDRPQLEFAFEEAWPQGGLGRELNFLFADKDRALLWKSALQSTVKKIVYSEAHSEATLQNGQSEEPYRIYGIKADLHIFVETYGMRPAHLIEPSRSSVPILLHKYLAELGLVRQKQGPISLSSSSRSCFSRDGQLRRELGFGLKKST